MPKKRKASGRTKGRARGQGETVQCSACGKLVPLDKAKKIYRRSSFIDPKLATELRKRGAYIPGSQGISYYCISCAVHRGLYSPRSKDQRRRPFRRERR